MATTLRARHGDTLDALLWRDAGRDATALPAVLEANPGIAGNGPLLTAGTPVIVPDNAPANAARPVIQLWT